MNRGPFRLARVLKKRQAFPKFWCIHLVIIFTYLWWLMDAWEVCLWSKSSTWHIANFLDYDAGPIWTRHGKTVAGVSWLGMGRGLQSVFGTWFALWGSISDENPLTEHQLRQGPTWATWRPMTAIFARQASSCCLCEHLGGLNWCDRPRVGRNPKSLHDGTDLFWMKIVRDLAHSWATLVIWSSFGVLLTSLRIRNG